MAKEVERKFLVDSDQWRGGVKGVLYRQGYLVINTNFTIRVRVAGSHGYLTIKISASGITRLEYEYAIPLEDATELLDRLCKNPIIEKTRYRVQHSGMVWEVDEFHGDNNGLVLAEVELDDEHQEINLPKWVGKEVSAIPKFYNASLVDNPFSNWPDCERNEVLSNR